MAQDIYFFLFEAAGPVLRQSARRIYFVMPNLFRHLSMPVIPAKAGI